MSDVISRVTAALVGRYRIERELGGGGMSRVFVAEEIALGRTVVIKVIAPELVEGISSERFAREVKLAARLQQANIVPVLSAGDADGLPYYTMPFVRGESLRTRIGSGERIAVGQAVSILRDVARALAYAHSEGIVHRDIKPENILLSHGTAVVTDFGIAKAISASRTQPGSTRATLTQLGTSVGTPAYMAPEQVAGDPSVDHRADLYAWGVVAWEILGGKHPFADRTTPQALIAAHIAERPAPIAEQNAAVPAALATLVMRCLEKDPAARPQSADEVLAALDAAGTPVPTASTPEAPTPRRRLTAILAAAGLLAVATLGIWVARGRSFKGPSTADARKSLAVLPFEDLSPDHSSRYLGDGIAETLINALTNVSGLRVAGRTSAFSFRDRAGDIREVARQLGVATVLEGSVQRSGDRLRVTAQLIKASDGLNLWSQNFDRDTRDIFAVQDEVARAVVTALHGSVLAQTDTALAMQGTRNPAAYDAYLLGRFYWSKRTAPDMVQAAHHFEQAILADSDYARAWSGLADSYVLFIPAEYDVPGIRADSILDLAEKAARHAVTLAPDLGEAWSSLGEVLEYRNKWVEARQAFERGVTLSPNYPTAHQWYSYDLSVWNRWDEAMREMERARDLDPLSLVIVVSLAAVYDGAERWGAAKAAYAQAEAIDPNHGLVVLFRFLHDLLHGDVARWADDYRHYGRFTRADSTATAAVARQLEDSTRRGAALREMGRTGGPYFRLVIARLLSGDDAAIAWVRGLERSPDLAKVNSVGIFTLIGSTLRANPRMQAALQRLGYPKPTGAQP